MKKIFLLAAITMFMSSQLTFANGGGKNKNKEGKARTEKNCPKPCPQPCPPCCDKGKCERS